MTEEGLEVTQSLAETFETADLIEIDLADNAMGPRGLSRVKSMFQNSSLQRLNLGNCGLSAESMELLKTYVLADDKRIANGLTDLVLDRNMMGPDGAKVVGEILPHCKKLKSFSYLGCRTREEGTRFLAKGLLGMVQDCDRPALSKLELDDCTFGGDEDPAYEPLSEALKKCSQMRYLNVTDGNFQNDGLAKLIGGLTESGATMTHLLLGMC